MIWKESPSQTGQRNRRYTANFHQTRYAAQKWEATLNRIWRKDPPRRCMRTIMKEVLLRGDYIIKLWAKWWQVATPVNSASLTLHDAFSLWNLQQGNIVCLHSTFWTRLFLFLACQCQIVPVTHVIFGRCCSVLPIITLKITVDTFFSSIQSCIKLIISKYITRGLQV